MATGQKWVVTLKKMQMATRQKNSSTSQLKSSSNTHLSSPLLPQLPNFHPSPTPKDFQSLRLLGVARHDGHAPPNVELLRHPPPSFHGGRHGAHKLPPLLHLATGSQPPPAASFAFASNALSVRSGQVGQYAVCRTCVKIICFFCKVQPSAFNSVRWCTLHTRSLTSAPSLFWRPCSLS